MLVSTAAAIKPFKDRRVRQALALTLDRPKIIKQLFNGFGVPGNDGPFAALYPSSDPTVPQRKQNLVQAKKLLAQAGYPKGFQVTLTTEKYVEIPAARADPRGLREEGRHRHQAQHHHARAPTTAARTRVARRVVARRRGSTRRSTSRTTATAPCRTSSPAPPSRPAASGARRTTRTRRSTRRSTPTPAALTVKEQRKYTGIAQRLLLRDTPVIIPYFYNWTMAGDQEGQGLQGLRDRHDTSLSKTSLG